jgi:amino acid adenylation domain-containing protein
VRLHEPVLLQSAQRPGALAVKAGDGSLTYGELDALANRIARALRTCGVSRGDRVAIWLEKSTVAVASMQAALRLGAAYVPVDPLSPVARTQHLLSDCQVAALVSTRGRAESVCTEALSSLRCLCVDGGLNGPGWSEVMSESAAPLPDPGTREDDLAYILYTSGSTGRPKGVCISHRNCLAFVRWAAEELALSSHDRLANHAPLHFDLSVFDLYGAFLSGAAVFLIPDGVSFAPTKLVELLLAERVTLWYSVPSVLIMMMDQGGLLDAPELPLRAVLFAGEVFPLGQLRRLRERWPRMRYLNLYGPTETNVCTYYEVGELEADRALPVPIGSACSEDQVWAVGTDGSVAGTGEEGELMVSGPTVMLGYWGGAPQGDAPYATGDIVRVLDGDAYQFVGRSDHMVKVRGYRIELGEIEAVLQEHPDVGEAAVLALGEGLDARLFAFVVAAGEGRPSLLAIKQHCAARLPRYMIVDRLRHLERLPRTRTGKVDALSLRASWEQETEEERP